MALRLIPCLFPLFGALLGTGSGSDLTPSAGGALGELARAGLWGNAGGPPARTGTSDAAPPRGEPGLLWSRELDGTAEDEPRVFADLALVEVVRSPGLRALHVLDLADGTPRFPALNVRSSRPLAPAVAEGVAVFRRGERRLEALDLQGRTLHEVWQYEADVPISAPLLVGREVYLCSERGLLRLDVGGRSERWTAPGRFRGVPSVLGDSVYAVRYDERGRALLGEYARSDGRRVAEVEVGHHGGAVPDPGPRPRIVVTPRELFVHHALGVPAANGRTAPAAWVDLGRGRLSAAPVSLVGSTGPTAAAGAARVGRFETPGHGVALAVREAWEPEALRVLATADLHPAVLREAPAPTSVASGDVLLLGRWGVSAGDARVLWELPPGPRGRAVPLNGGFLCVREGRTLEAWGTGADGRVEHELGRVLAGLRAGLADRTLDLARDALRSRHVGLASELVAAAAARGAKAAELARLRRDLDLLAAQRAVQVLEDSADRTAREARDLVGFVPDGLVAAARAERDRELKLRLVEEALERDPDHPGALQAVREALPSGTEPPPLFDGREWLELARLARRYDVRAVEARGEDAAAEALRAARGRWRRDLVAFATRRVVVVTPTRRPGAVARCLATGELVCRMLDETFARRAEEDAPPLVVHLYETREEYLQRGGTDAGENLEWTAGHYDPDAELSRLYLPDSSGAERSVLSTFAHELTHHWMDRHLPADPTPGARGPRPTDAGFWIVEGFASMVEDFTFDLAAGTWEADPARSHRLDLLREVTEDVGPRWSELVRLSQADFARLPRAGRLSVPSSWYLGQREELSDRSVFYLRSAALAWGLFRGSGTQRQLLLRAARDYYAGRGSGRSVGNPAAVGRGVLGELR